MMQPPPRKVKHAAVLKNIHSEQVSKLQAKHQQECELLEDIRNFSRQRSIIEKEYAQSLLKLTTSLLKREFSATPDLSTDDGQEHKTALGVWRTILEETERLAKARLQASEIYMEKIAEPLKPLKSAKIQCYKKMVPQLTTYQQEVSQTVNEMVKSQKTYNIDQTLTHDARQKAAEANDRLSRKSTGIFTSLASLQKNCAKLNTRRDGCEVKSTNSRNEYLLCLAASSAHQHRYYSTDLPDLIDTLDGDMYDHIRDYFLTYGKAALDVSTQEKSACENIFTEADLIDRNFNHQCFLYCNKILTDKVQYQFEPCHNDKCNKISKEHGADLQVDKEARKWATKIAKETKTIRDHEKTLKALEATAAGDLGSDSGTGMENNQQEIEQKIEEMKQHIRKAETAKDKAEARIEMLRDSGVNVDEWLASAQAESLRVEEDAMSRSSSQVSVRSDSTGKMSNEIEQTYTKYDDDDDFIDDTFEATKYDDSYLSHGSSEHAYPVPKRCRAIYDFQASNGDELDMVENEQLEIISSGEGDGWVKGRNHEGREGYIPENYVEMFGDNENIEFHPVTQSDFQATSPPHTEVVSPTSSIDPMRQEVTSYSSSDMEVQMTTNTMPVDNPDLSDGIWARALYDYSGLSDEELSFNEGMLIKVLRKDDNGVDDGYWEGEINGKVGVFPSLVVEVLHSGLKVPPQLSPPPVTITPATPAEEIAPSPLSPSYKQVSARTHRSSSQHHRKPHSNHRRSHSGTINADSYESAV
ncbi:F-BAR and double SH3 domains protein 2-like isoform X2 [Mytilus galloprovincialis]|uniref:F-BAR and double SH3 domains protein 2-like isoform X2 n=1 Tax=Mytilus galloprovincialis TaxID=29158 RepID=UPI003F7B5757